MRFTFLGTGTSAGIPMIGCGCGVCRSDDPRDRRLRVSALLEWTDPEGTDRAVLIDAGPDLRQQVLRHTPMHADAPGLMHLDAILFTHNHVDHTWGLDEVRRFNAVMRRPIDVYADRHTLGHLRRVYAHIFDSDQNVQPSFVASLVPHELKPLEPVELWGLRITPLRVFHGRMPILGFRIEPGRNSSAADAGWAPLAFCTDTSLIPDETWPMLGGLSTLVLDALRPRPHETHFTLRQAIEAAERINADRTWFIHMSHDLPHAATDAGLPERMRLAHDGLTLA